MTTYQPYSNFTAQSRTVSALMSIYAQLERDSAARIELSPIVVFLAFATESYLNSIGARQLEIWDELERLSWKKKVVILYKTAKRSVDWGKDPLQFATEVFALKDRLAHGKAERVVGPVFNNQDDANRFLNSQDLRPDWHIRIRNGVGSCNPTFLGAGRACLAVCRSALTSRRSSLLGRETGSATVLVKETGLSLAIQHLSARDVANRGLLLDLASEASGTRTSD